MNLVMDKANFISLLHDKEMKECNDVIRKGINLILNFRKEEIEEWEEKDKEISKEWMRHNADGGKKFSIEYCRILETENLKTNFLNSELKLKLECNNKLDKKIFRYAFLLENEKIVEYIKEKGTILIGKLGEERDLILSVKLEDTETLTYKISSWEDYCPKIPVSDIIICDNHYFKHKSVYTENSNELIKALCKLPTEAPVNVVIITKQSEVDPSIDLQEKQEEIQKIVKKITDSQKSNVSIVLTSATHDRDIITNYYRIKNGASFHLRDNGLKNNVSTEIKTHANKNNEEMSDELIAEYKRIVENNKKTTYGSVICRFFE